MKNLARNTESVGLDVPQENGILPQKRPIAMLDDTSDEAKRLAAAALSAVKAATAAAPSRATAAAPSRGKIGVITIFPYSVLSPKFVCPAVVIFSVVFY